MKEFTLNGKTYLPEVESNECDGCVGKGNLDLCGQLPGCHDVIFTEMEENK